MPYILTNGGNEGGGGHDRQGRPLAAMRSFHGPNVVILSRASEPPVPRIKREDEKEEAREAATSAGSDGANKKELRGFSASSSANLSRLLSMLDWQKNGQCIHVTLTYSNEWPRDKTALARAKSSITARLGEMGVCGIWRLEFQSRESAAERAARVAKRIKRERGQGGSLKVPHWHILLWIRDRDPAIIERNLVEWWHGYSGNSSPFAIKISRGDQARGAWYLAKHHAKSQQAPPFAVGRWWGYIDRDSVLGASDLHCHGVVENRIRVWWSRLYRRATGCKVRGENGFSWFLPRRSQTDVGAWLLEHIEWERAGRPRPGSGGVPF